MEVRARAALSAVLDPGSRAVLAAVADVGAVEVLDRIGRGDPRLDPSGRYRRLASDVDGAGVLAEGERAGATFVVPGARGWPTCLEDLRHVAVAGMGGVPVGLWLAAGWADGPLGTSPSSPSSPSPPSAGPEARPGPDEEPGPVVALVGSRAATRYGVDVATELAADLAEGGALIVSGAAYGVDAAAHRGAMAVGGTTAAVLAGGVDVPYPRGHHGLLRRIREKGMVLSEVAPGRTVTRRSFLARNRLVACLAAGVVVVEAGRRSGALNTVTWAEQLSRVVCAVPGPVTSALSVGPHGLIRAGQLLVTGAAEVREALAPLGTGLVEPPPPASERLFDGLGDDDRILVESFPAAGSVDVTALLATTGLTLGRVIGALDRLAMAGVVEGGGERWSLAAAYRRGR